MRSRGSATSSAFWASRLERSAHAASASGRPADHRRAARRRSTWRLARAPGIPLDPAYQAAFAEIDSDPRQLLAVAIIDDSVVGCLQLTIIPGLSRLGASRALIEGVRVASDFRNGGIGEIMIDWAKQGAIRRGCQLLQLTTDRSRHDARRFYERLGFMASHVGMKLELVAAPAHE